MSDKTLPAAVGSSAELGVGDKVRTLTSIWDDGADCHPPGYLARAGEVLIVRKISDRWICVSHEDITDSSFCLHPGEWERVPHNTEADRAAEAQKWYQ